MKLLTISLVTYNSERYLRDFVQSLKAQTFDDYDVIVIDNNSADASLATIREFLPSAHIVSQSSNLGYGRAHNLAVAWSKTPYVAAVNPDIIMHVDCLEQLLRALERIPDAGSVGPRLLTQGSIGPTTPDVIDSAGLTIARSYRVRDRLQGSVDQSARVMSVFGISGSFVVYRRDALEDVKEPRSNARGSYEYFDEDFFMYKEDVDLAWRMINAGWKHYHVPSAVCYHYRGVSGLQSSWQERKARSAINRYSYRNHIVTILKNHHWPVTFKHLAPILWFEIQKCIYLLFLDRSPLGGLRECVRLLPAVRMKRKYLQSRRRIHWREFAQHLS